MTAWLEATINQPILSFVSAEYLCVYPTLGYKRADELVLLGVLPKYSIVDVLIYRSTMEIRHVGCVLVVNKDELKSWY